MCGKIVNVILNSNNAISGSTNSNANYFVDWSAILKLNTPYKLHFTYVGQSNVLTASSKLAQVQVNFLMENYFNKTNNVVGVPTTFTIGVLRSAFLNGTINSLYAGDNDNTKIYLPNRPLNNNFNVQILTNDATPVVWTDNKTLPGPPITNDFQPPGAYILTLSFQEMESNE